MQVEPSVLYVEDGSVYTAAGSAAGIDLGLHLVRQDYGSDIANQVARRMVVPPHRDGGQSQFVATAMPPPDGSLAPIMEWASGRLDQPLDAATLARKGRMSMRTLARRFEAQAGTTPHQWLTHQRVLAAQRLLETSDASIERVAELSGFTTPETLRHPLPAPRRARRRWRIGDDSRSRPARPAQRITSSTGTIVTGPRFVARTGASMVARSPTITTARRSISRYDLATRVMSAAVTFCTWPT